MAPTLIDEDGRPFFPLSEWTLRTHGEGFVLLNFRCLLNTEKGPDVAARSPTYTISAVQATHLAAALLTHARALRDGENVVPLRPRTDD